MASSAVAASRARRSRRARATAAQPRANGKIAKRLTRTVIVKIGEGIELGYALEGAAAHAGIPTRTLWTWLARGRNGSGTPLEIALAEVVELEEARLKSAALKRIYEAPDWRGPAWYLERRWPQEFGLPERQVKHGGAIGLYAAITPERLRDALAAGDITAEQAGTFAHVWRVLVGQAGGDVVEGEGLELQAGEAA